MKNFLPRNYKIILASKSPRRQFLLKELGLDFEVRTKEVDESFPSALKGSEVALYLCRKKAGAFSRSLKDNELLITADTIVWINNTVLNKPADAKEAEEMLGILSGNMHTVFTGVCLKSTKKEKIFYSATNVYFKPLAKEEIAFYIQNFEPYDKAGAYGAQEWIGYIGIEKIEGSYFNVMGLPVKEIFEELVKF